jgi:hypothetical protein
MFPSLDPTEYLLRKLRKTPRHVDWPAPARNIKQPNNNPTKTVKPKTPET